MTSYELSNEAKEDLIRINHYGIQQFGINQADKYFNSLFRHFELIAENPFSYESIDHLRKGYRRCVVGPDSIYFRIHNDSVQIMAIVGKQDINNKL